MLQIRDLARGAFALAIVVIVGQQAAHGVTITTAMGDGADAYIQKTFGNVNVNFGDASRIFARTSTDDRYEAMFLRFDVSDYQPGTFSGPASLGLTKWRDEETGLDLRIFGLDEAFDTWIEGDGGSDNSPAGELTYNNAPGILQDPAFDTDLDIDPAQTTDLGSVSPVGDEGDEILFSDASLVSFLNNDLDGLVSFIVARAADNRGIDDFASKETVSLDPSTPQFNDAEPGDFAPSLTFNAQLKPDPSPDIIPEPATTALTGLLALGLFARRRR